MPAPEPHVYRAIEVWEATALLRVSPLAIRVFLALFWGEDSERTCVVRCRTTVLAHDLESSKRAVGAALEELCAAKLLDFDSNAGVAGRPGFVERHLPPTRSNAVAWLRSLAGLPDCLIVTEARVFIEAEIERRSQRGTDRSTDRSTDRRPDRRPDPQDHRSTSPSISLSATPGVHRASAPFRPPTYEEVETALARNGWGADDAERELEANLFVGHHQKTGWRSNAGPITDWKAALTYWLAQGEARRRRQQVKAAGPGGRFSFAFPKSE